MDILKDFYIGFEGEPEIIFYFENSENQRVLLKAWIGYFDSIMAAIQPNETGWSGLTYYYHMDTAWFKESPWRIPDLGDALNNLQSANITELDQETINFYQKLSELLREAQSLDGEVWIEYY